MTHKSLNTPPEVSYVAVTPIPKHFSNKEKFYTLYWESDIIKSINYKPCLPCESRH